MGPTLLFRQTLPPQCARTTLAAPTSILLTDSAAPLLTAPASHAAIKGLPLQSARTTQDARILMDSVAQRVMALALHAVIRKAAVSSGKSMFKNHSSQFNLWNTEDLVPSV